jgi:hypothetical protein
LHAGCTGKLDSRLNLLRFMIALQQVQFFGVKRLSA